MNSGRKRVQTRLGSSIVDRLLQMNKRKLNRHARSLRGRTCPPLTNQSIGLSYTPPVSLAYYILSVLFWDTHPLGCKDGKDHKFHSTCWKSCGLPPLKWLRSIAFFYECMLTLSCTDITSVLFTTNQRELSYLPDCPEITGLGSPLSHDKMFIGNSTVQSDEFTIQLKMVVFGDLEERFF